MTTDVPNTQSYDLHPQASAPHASMRRNPFPEYWKVPRVLAGFMAVVGLVFLFFSNRPLWHTDLWGHLAYGRLIWNTGKLPDTEPLMPLAADTPLVDTAWLSQILAYHTHDWLGTAGLQCLYGASISLCVALLISRWYQKTRSALLPLIGIALFLWIEWQQFRIIRPQLAGVVCFISLLVLLTGRRWSRVFWVLIPGLFALWANLHGSFIMGLGLLGCFCVGRAIDIAWRTRNVRTILGDKRARRLALLTGLVTAAVLLNPYGVRLYYEVLTFSSHPNLASLVEWKPLTLRMSQGQAAATTALALIFAYRLSPLRVTAAEVLLLVGLGVGMLWLSRMIVWWAPVATHYLVIHGAAIWREMRRSRTDCRPSPRSGTWTAITAGLISLTAANTPLGWALLHGHDTDLRQSVSPSTPVGAVAYLREHPPQGQVFNAYTWGDYLLWAGPENVQVFVASHVHLIPREVWHSYLRVINLTSDWKDILNRYDVNTVFVDYRYRRHLIARLKRDEEWELAYEDKQSAVFVRRNTISSPK